MLRKNKYTSLNKLSHLTPEPCIRPCFPAFRLPPPTTLVLSTSSFSSPISPSFQYDLISYHPRPPPHSLTQLLSVDSGGSAQGIQNTPVVARKTLVLDLDETLIHTITQKYMGSNRCDLKLVRARVWNVMLCNVM